MTKQAYLQPFDFIYHHLLIDLQLICKILHFSFVVAKNLAESRDVGQGSPGLFHYWTLLFYTHGNFFLSVQGMQDKYVQFSALVAFYLLWRMLLRLLILLQSWTIRVSFHYSISVPSSTPPAFFWIPLKGPPCSYISRPRTNLIGRTRTWGEGHHENPIAHLIPYDMAVACDRKNGCKIDTFSVILQ